MTRTAVVVAAMSLLASAALAQDPLALVGSSTSEILKQGILGAFCALFIGIAIVKDREAKALSRENAATIAALHKEHAKALEEKDQAILDLTIAGGKERAELVAVMRRYATNAT